MDTMEIVSPQEAISGSTMNNTTCGNQKDFYPPVHKKPDTDYSFERLEMLWERYPQYHERTTFSTMDALLEEHLSLKKTGRAKRPAKKKRTVKKKRWASLFNVNSPISPPGVNLLWKILM